MVTVLMMSAKLASPGLLKLKIFQNERYGVIILDCGVTNKILSRDSSYIVDVIMWPKFGKFSISMRGYHNLNFIRIWPEKTGFFFEGLSWFKFSNFGLALGMTLEFYASVAKRLKVIVRKSWGLFQRL